MDIKEYEKIKKSPIIFNETEWGEFLYNNRDNPSLEPKIYTVKELIIYAKYLRHILKLSEKDVKNGLIKFCNLNWIGFDSDIEYNKINIIMKAAYETEERTIVGIPITTNEWNTICKLDTEKAKKSLFVTLVVAKFNRLNPIKYEEDETKEKKEYLDTRLRCNLKDSEINRLAGIGFKDKQENYRIYREYGKHKLIDIPNTSKISRILNFGDLNPTSEETLVVVEDLNEMMKYYGELSKDPRIKICEKCGKKFRDNSPANKQYLCSNCKKAPTKTDIKLRNQEEKRHAYKKDKRKEKEFSAQFKIIKCEQCGKEFKISSRGKRKLCDDCYEKYRKTKINENAKKYYTSKK